MYPVFVPMTDVSMAVSGGSVLKPVPTSSDTDYILSIFYEKYSMCMLFFKTVYLIILNEEKGGTCEAKLKLIEA